MFYFWDPTLIILLPALVFAIWAQRLVKSTFAEWSEITVSRGISGAKAANMILREAGINIQTERISGKLTDHYDPRHKVLGLSQAVYDSQSVAAIGIAAHECGHAIQHSNGYSPLIVRNAIVPVVSLGSSLAFPLFFIGMIFSLPILLKIGIIMFTAAVAFHLITLPVEFDASRKAIAVLERMSILRPDELIGAKTVLKAAAMTYVAAATMAILNLLRMILLSRRR